MRAASLPSARVPSTPRSAVHQALVRFVVRSLVALVLLTVGTVLVSNRIAHDEAQRDAQQRGSGIARGVAAPLVNRQVRAGDPAATARLAEVLTNRMRDGSVSHMKVWDRRGRVIWSDETALVGVRFTLPKRIDELFGTSLVNATFTSPHREDNDLDGADGPYYEVYVGAFDADHEPIVFETYISPKRLSADERAIMLELLPLGLGALVAFQLAILPLALSLARRVRLSQEERSKILRGALMASDLERRRISQEMHDVVVQKLAAVGYALPAVADGLAPGPASSSARATLDRTEALLHESVQSLRAVLADIYPPELHDVSGLRAALQDLADGAVQSSVRIDLVFAEDLTMPTDAARLVYRIVREGLRNVLRHAHASRAWVTVSGRGPDIDVRVEDDGVGLSASAERGHLGVRLLSDTVLDVGGDLELRTGSRGGAVLAATFPAVLT